MKTLTAAATIIIALVSPAMADQGVVKKLHAGRNCSAAYIVPVGQTAGAWYTVVASTEELSGRQWERLVHSKDTGSILGYDPDPAGQITRCNSGSVGDSAFVTAIYNINDPPVERQ